MANDLPASIQDTIKERLKSIVGELIPDEAYNAIVQKAVHDFRTVDLPKLVKEELTAQYKIKIAEELNSPEWQAFWDCSGRGQASVAVKDMIIESAPLILANMIGAGAQQVMSNLKYQLTGQY